MSVPEGPVLLTGFEPFDGRPTNASWDAVRAVAAGWRWERRLVTACLPVSFRRARQELRALVGAHAPAVVVAVGEAAGRGAVGLERVAVNVIDARIPDADGSAPVDVPVVAGAPTAFLSTLPLKAAHRAVQALGVPVEVSGTAGTYVCNATFYALQHLLARTPQVRGGFVHVPCVPGQAADGTVGLPTADAARALAATIELALSREGDERTSAGTLD
ncbi:pyroglutamyl-peptidase I [Cellulomonas sp. APG4]|uniref:pyroglutamyl-peptidase I family protein n=1 Tax=Cellulomonas sp. APG4 TaxID=1538656 RepID=UPI00137A42FD|nr:pyroglutamyl-peptidase I [Cellulomonas sp. APG4]NCT89791.1 pyroglutamyl-peptidase I [Cellulomonas sp. APG4]